MPGLPSRAERKAHAEQMTAQAVIAQLLSEGRRVGSLRRPALGPNPSPDFLIELDGETVAIEVTWFLHPPDVQKAAAQIQLIERDVKPLLLTDATRLGAKIALSVTFRVAPLAASHRAEIAAWSTLLSPDPPNA